MSITDSARHLWRKWRNNHNRRQPGPTVWHHPDYRVALEGLGLETKRADLVLWALIDRAVISPEDVRRPRRIGYSDLALVHSPHLLEGLSSAETLAPIFGANANELPAERIATTIRLACGATLAGTRRALAGAGPQVNLLGGFHHASPLRGGGFSVVNDIAVAIHVVRGEGFTGTIGVLDLDAHPPDGTSDCLAAAQEAMGEVWIGSISGCDWGELPAVDETVMTGAGDVAYLAALHALLNRMPPCELVFVVAGGDVLAGDRFGGLALTLDGALQRDRRVAHKLGGTPAVWLAAGGYSERAWQVLYNTVGTLALRESRVLPPDYQPLRERFARVARELDPPRDEDSFFSELDLVSALGMPAPGGFRLLDCYTAEWVEYAFHRYGLLEHIERLGYSHFRVHIERLEDGDRMRLFGQAHGVEHLLISGVVDNLQANDESYLFVNWLTLRHPLATFSASRPQLPNQEVPGLGLAREADELLAVVARRLHHAGVAIRPAAYHVAFKARNDFSFEDPAREGRFRKLLEDLGHTPLAELTVAIESGRVTLDAHPYAWEPTLMVARLDGRTTQPVPCDGVFELSTSSD